MCVSAVHESLNFYLNRVFLDTENVSKNEGNIQRETITKRHKTNKQTQISNSSFFFCRSTNLFSYKERNNFTFRSLSLHTHSDRLLCTVSFAPSRISLGQFFFTWCFPCCMSFLVMRFNRFWCLLGFLLRWVLKLSNVCYPEANFCDKIIFNDLNGTWKLIDWSV